MVGESAETVGAGVGGGSGNTKMPTLEEYGTNLTKLAEDVSHGNENFSTTFLSRSVRLSETLYEPLISLALASFPLWLFFSSFLPCSS